MWLREGVRPPLECSTWYRRRACDKSAVVLENCGFLALEGHREERSDERGTEGGRKLVFSDPTARMPSQAAPSGFEVYFKPELSRTDNLGLSLVELC